MKLKVSALVLGLLAHSSLFAAVTISAPEELIVLSVNDQDVKSSLFKGDKSFKVEAGPVSLNVRYQEYFELHNARFDIQKSGVIRIEAPELKDNQHYQLALVNPPKDEEEGRKFAMQPTIAIYDQNNQLIVQQTGASEATKSLLDGGIFSKVAKITGSNNVPNQPEPIYATQVKPAQVTPQEKPTAVVKISNHIQKSAVNPSADQHLIQIWQQASKVERQKFLSWLADQ